MLTELVYTLKYSKLKICKSWLLDSGSCNCNSHYHSIRLGDSKTKAKLLIEAH